MEIEQRLQGKVTSILSMLHNGDTRGAYNRTEKLLKQQNGSRLAKMLMAYVLSKSGKTHQCAILVDKLFPNPSFVAYDANAETDLLLRCYRELDRGDLAKSILENIYKRGCNDEWTRQYMYQLLYAQDYETMQRISYELYRQHNLPMYLSWYLMSIVLSLEYFIGPVSHRQYVTIGIATKAATDYYKGTVCKDTREDAQEYYYHYLDIFFRLLVRTSSEWRLILEILSLMGYPAEVSAWKYNLGHRRYALVMRLAGENDALYEYMCKAYAENKTINLIIQMVDFFGDKSKTFLEIIANDPATAFHGALGLVFLLSKTHERSKEDPEFSSYIEFAIQEGITDPNFISIITPSLHGLTRFARRNIMEELAVDFSRGGIVQMNKEWLRSKFPDYCDIVERIRHARRCILKFNPGNPYTYLNLSTAATLLIKSSKEASSWSDILLISSVALLERAIQARPVNMHIDFGLDAILANLCGMIGANSKIYNIVKNCNMSAANMEMYGHLFLPFVLTSGNQADACELVEDTCKLYLQHKKFTMVNAVIALHNNRYGEASEQIRLRHHLTSSVQYAYMEVERQLIGYRSMCDSILEAISAAKRVSVNRNLPDRLFIVKNDNRLFISVRFVEEPDFYTEESREMHFNAQCSIIQIRFGIANIIKELGVVADLCLKNPETTISRTTFEEIQDLCMIIEKHSSDIAMGEYDWPIYGLSPDLYKGFLETRIPLLYIAQVRLLVTSLKENNCSFRALHTDDLTEMIIEHLNQLKSELQSDINYYKMTPILVNAEPVIRKISFIVEFVGFSSMLLGFALVSSKSTKQNRIFKNNYKLAKSIIECINDFKKLLESVAIFIKDQSLRHKDVDKYKSLNSFLILHRAMSKIPNNVQKIKDDIRDDLINQINFSASLLNKYKTYLLP